MENAERPGLLDYEERGVLDAVAHVACVELPRIPSGRVDSECEIVEVLSKSVK